MIAFIRSSTAGATGKLAPEVDAKGFRKIYEEIDLPLAPVLARMERTGIRLDPAVLEEQCRLYMMTVW